MARGQSDAVRYLVSGAFPALAASFTGASRLLGARLAPSSVTFDILALIASAPVD